MGTLTLLSPILGVLAGTIIAKHTEDELKAGKRYLNWLASGLLALVLGVAIYNWGIIPAIISSALVFILLITLVKSHRAEFLPALAIPAVLAPPSIITILLYSIVNSSLELKRRKSLFQMAALYVVLVLITQATVNYI